MNKHLSSGVLAALAAYTMWGAFPLMFRLVEHVEPATVVATRILWAFLFVGIGLLIFRRFDEVRATFKDIKALKGILIAALLLSGNWLVFIWTVDNHRVLEASFGYFINPLVNVCIGVLLLKEKLDTVQKGAITLAVVAVGLQAIALGQIPWISLVLAISFGFYGYFRKTVNVSSAPGLWLEVMMMSPLALAYLLLMPGATHVLDGWTLFLLAGIGIATALPLLCFAYAARRMPLIKLGMFQYISPTVSFLIAVFIFHEPIGVMQLASFILICISLAIFSAHSWHMKNREKSMEPVEPE